MKDPPHFSTKLVKRCFLLMYWNSHNNCQFSSLTTVLQGNHPLYDESRLLTNSTETNVRIYRMGVTSYKELPLKLGLALLQTLYTPNGG